LELRDAGTQAPLAGSPLAIRPGDWRGAVTAQRGRLLLGQARDLLHPLRDVAVVAYSGGRIMAFATAKASENGSFALILPAHLLDGTQRQVVHVGIAGSDYLLRDGTITLGHKSGIASPALHPVALAGKRIRIKISTPNLKEAQAWGDFHFANSLRRSFEKIGHSVAVDTQDSWYANPHDEDVVIALRGRHRYKTDPAKINIMWLISHPDRIDPAEYADYDHVAVASDIYCAQLRASGLPSVSTLHQAVDAGLFTADPALPRKPACLFVGNSRREYRTMVRWCLQRNIPLELYGGGWDGIVAPDLVRAQNIANDELAGYYASHLILLNDHWDSMRDNGFISNRMFDGSAVATPILTDKVQGLAEVFGDTISTAETIDAFEAVIKDCLANPAPYLARARDAQRIVLAHHTFDHRAVELNAIIEQVTKP